MRYLDHKVPHNQILLRDFQFPLPPSLHSKSTSLLHGLGQLVTHLLLTSVGWQVEPVKAGVSLGEVVGVHLHQMQGEQARTSSTS